MHRAHKSLLLLLPALLVMASTPSHAVTPARQPIYIESDTLSIDEKKGLSHYQGHVKFKQGTLVINANSIKLLAKNGAIKKIFIHGKPTHLKQQPAGQQHPVIATANRIEYLASTEIVHLYGNALVTQGSQRFSGEHIQYNSQTAQVSAQGSTVKTETTETGNGQGRVKAVIMPKREMNP